MTDSTLVFNLGADFVNPSLPYVENDAIINSNSVMLFDFLNTNCWPSQIAPVNGSLFNNLVRNALTASVNLSGYSLGFSGGGITFPAATDAQNRKITMPDASKLAATVAGLLWIIWIKHDATANASGFNAVAGFGDGAGTTCQYTLAHAASTNNYKIDVSGTQLTIPGAPSTTPMQIATSFDNTTGAIKVYKNNVLAVSGVGTIPLNVPASTVRSTIGSLASYGSLWQGSVYRDYLEASATTNHAAIIAADYTNNVSRFS